MNGKIAMVVLVLSMLGCSSEDNASGSGTESTSAPVSIAGQWRAVLTSPGGELPFELVIGNDQSSGHVLNGEEVVPFSEVTRDGQHIEMTYRWYDSEITAEVSADGAVMRGRWRKTYENGVDSSLPFSATRGMAVRFLPLPGQSETVDISGTWAVEFTDEDGNEPARGEFVQTGKQVSGTFMTPTGDYRYLAGSFEQGRLRLSAFDGGHVFLFDAALNDDGSLVGDFWSRETYHATWKASRASEGQEILPDAWAQVAMSDGVAGVSFAFENLKGQTVSLSDPRYAGKPVLLNLFGTWCPNCNDEAPILSRWYSEYRDQGLEIVGLAFEYTGDVERDREMIGRFKARHDIDYELLLAGTFDKGDAADTLDFIDNITAYPTTIFLDKNHKVQKIHSGFSGPGTGSHHTEMVAELKSEMLSLLTKNAQK
ncbi:MAG: TlpA disulfide reductase family protein [Lysobacterales bacterium]